MLLPQEQEKIFLGLLKRKQNAFCAECGSKSPCWASLDFGVFVCLNCSGAHRALGPSVTRVKSIRLDTWNRDWLELMQVGNTIINLYYEHLLSNDRKSKPNEHSPQDFLNKFVRDKYVRKLYADPKESLNPLEKWKAGKATKKQVSSPQNPNQPTVSIVKNDAPRSNKFQKAATLNVPLHSKSVNKAGTVDFSFFDEIMSVKKPSHASKPPKPPSKQTNLISFDEEKPKEKPKNNAFEDFQFSVGLQKPKEQKYNKQQFMSMGGIKPNKQKTQVTFDFFAQTPKPAKKVDNLISFQNPSKPEKPQYTMYNDYGVASQQVHQQNQQQYNKSHFATISGDYQVRQGFFAVSGQKTNGNTPKADLLHSYGFENSWIATEGFPFAPQIHQKLKKVVNGNITLESNINLSKPGEQNRKKGVQASANSWVDEWK